jgi:hypothetical protein
MVKTLQWKCDGKIPITMLINTFKHKCSLSVFLKENKSNKVLWIVDFSTKIHKDCINIL